VLVTGLVLASRAAWIATGPALRPVGALLIVGALLGAATLGGISRMQSHATFYGAVSESYRSYALGSVAATDAGERMLTDAPPGAFAIGDDLVRLADPAVRDELPIDEAGAADRVTAEGVFYVGVSEKETFGLFGPALVTLDGFDRETLVGSGCHDYQATRFDPMLVAAVGEGVELSISGSTTQITTTVERDAVASSPRTWDVEPGEVYVASTAKDATLRIRLNAGGRYAICSGQ
jgi:hypothetical protein